MDKLEKACKELSELADTMVCENMATIEELRRVKADLIKLATKDKGIDWTQNNVFDAIGRPDLKPQSEKPCLN